MVSGEDFPLRVEAVGTAWAAEHRTDEAAPPSQNAGWQLVYVRTGVIEERCHDKTVLLRAGGILLHQPEELFAMRAVGEIPPEVLRIEFFCSSAAMDRFRGVVFHAEPAERQDLTWLMKQIVELYDPPPSPGQCSIPRQETPKYPAFPHG